ncbi:DUF1540 domain-containing protein [Paenibacillus sp. IB182496]|uniref:DUF1540 domain-containing protein n=1 Tax=Paenibacillus sabuli TaxID=2772509 RepID=A0A927BR71_9BACL|nr:DUF1540 domain-containing protein [Paenibacillus sabuli]MBD2844431.1 DUF1540 domain-containing protein [Paenibacillus sabuli]
MPKGVKCSVSNCSFWEHGNQCAADQIMIDVDKHADMDTEFADEGLGAEHRDAANSSSVTCCHTFKQKDESCGC